MARPPSFANELRRFMRKFSYTPSQLGRAAIGDPNFVGDILAGKRSPTERLMNRMREWMSETSAKHRAARAEAGDDDRTSA